jgi:hypothetical protein
MCLLVITGNYPDAENAFATRAAIPLSIGFLPLLLQTTLPFDFRLEGVRVMDLRTLPIAPLQAVLAVLAVPTLVCLACQTLSILALSCFGQFEPMTLAWIVLGYPAICAGVTAVWNLHSLLFSAKAHVHPSESGVNRAEGSMMALGLAAGAFFPAGLVLKLLSNTPGFATATAIGIQYVVDACVIALLAYRFQRLEAAD